MALYKEVYTMNMTHTSLTSIVLLLIFTLEIAFFIWVFPRKRQIKQFFQSQTIIKKATSIGVEFENFSKIAFVLIYFLHHLILFWHYFENHPWIAAALSMSSTLIFLTIYTIVCQSNSKRSTADK